MAELKNETFVRSENGIKESGMNILEGFSMIGISNIQSNFAPFDNSEIGVSFIKKYFMIFIIFTLLENMTYNIINKFIT